MALTGQVLAEGQAPAHAGITALGAPSGETWLLLSADFYNSGAGTNNLRLYLTKSGGTRRQIFKADLGPGDSVPWSAARHILGDGDTLDWSADNANEVNGVLTGFIRT